MRVTRYELTVHLVTDAPLHSGGVDEVVDRSRDPEDRTTVARRFARDGRGRPVLTGRSVKGALRAACQRFLEEHGGAVGPTERELRQLWGDDGTRGAGSAAPLRASAITVHTVELPTEGYEGDEEHKVMLPTRMGNAIDRYWGSAGDTALFEHEYLPRGKELALTITAEAGLPDGVEVPQGDVAPPGPEQVEKLFALIIGLIKDGRVAFGGRQNAGWGRVALSDSEKAWTLTKAEPGSRAGLEEWLSGAGGRSVDVAPVDCGGGGRMRIEITWDSPTGILVAEPQKDGPGEGADAGAADGSLEGADSEETKPARPLRAGPEETDPIVLPGSSVRGALRTRATRIARTILLAKKDPSTGADWSGAGVHEQLAQDPSLVRDLFGSTTHRGALTVLDTLTAEDGPSRKVTHNAGDRWTGGVADGLLYSEEVYDSTWNSVVLELDLDRLLTNAKAGLEEPDGQEGSRGEDRSRAAFCLLGLVLAELAAGTLPLGSRGTRGMGQVEVKAMAVTGGKGLGIEDWALKAEDGAGESLPRLILKGLRDVSSGIERNPRAGAGWEGWSSYLVSSSERPLEDKEERDA
ncbi:RAMP superfamily CRISPR-associated protein [Actinomyces sp. oral taxon 175]|uniref:RAMP superfamily CRISPR-associated protein n=1 Tax=Actinomyces sp. oral taxon 175 TaxID=712119 RepID=UPI00021D3528|nr:RAMP superfamily CRISPR-associated protein [Actinomyces sp. oral taxon 175]EGV13743.1 CRISPR-associated RAMP protein [Actinomyces sp. oral taxon 175 str. F0384]